MLSARRFRGFVLTFLFLVLFVYYYSGFLDSWRGNEILASPFPAKDVFGEPATETSIPELKPLKPETPLTGTGPTKLIGDSTPQLSTKQSDVLLIFKTGASTFWRRMPIHLTSTLSDGKVPNSVVYSDLSERLSNNIASVDTLSNVTSLLQRFDASAYSNYLELQSSRHVGTYREHARLPGDEPPDSRAGNPPGWVLDKYKFIPMLTHAQRNWPDLKWYIYIEDDTYVFWDNLLQWLATISPDEEPSYYGAFSGEGNDTFAQGGSGIVFSRSLMRTIFGGDDIPNLEKYGNYTANACCGDIILGKVLRDHGIFVNKKEWGPVSFRPEPPWKTGFDDLIWCSPVFTFHHLHQRDLVELAELERTHKESSLAARPILFRDVFTTFISPYLTNPSLPGWDNFASRYILTEASSSSIPPDASAQDNSTFNNAFQTPWTCEAACRASLSCLSWRHDLTATECALDTLVRLGRETDPQPAWAPPTEIVSGWMLDRINQTLLMQNCDIVNPLWTPPPHSK